MNKKKLDILIENEVNPLTQEQIKFLNGCTDGEWEYKDGFVNVKGDVFLSHTDIEILPVQFGHVSGDFNCQNNELTTLKGCPYEVGHSFWCDSNQLTSFRGCPPKINGDFGCTFNKFTTLDYLPVISNFIYLTPNPLILNDKLFNDLRRIGGKEIIGEYERTMKDLKEQIPIQFGITDESIITEIWQSYMNILESE